MAPEDALRATDLLGLACGNRTVILGADIAEVNGRGAPPAGVGASLPLGHTA